MSTPTVDPHSAVLRPLGSPVPPERLVSGEPQAAAHELFESGDVRVGIWEVTPGCFRSVKNGLTEVMYFLSGAGEILGDDGTRTVIEPGAIAIVRTGWSGTWTVTQTARKLYWVVRDEVLS